MTKPFHQEPFVDTTLDACSDFASHLGNLVPELRSLGFIFDWKDGNDERASGHIFRFDGVYSNPSSMHGCMIQTYKMLLHQILEFNTLVTKLGELADNLGKDIHAKKQEIDRLQREAREVQHQLEKPS